MVTFGSAVFGGAFRTLLNTQRRYIVKVVKTPEEYEAGLKVKDYALAKFSASWCKPCQKSKVFVEELSDEHPEFHFLEVDVDELPQIADEEGVKSIPMYKIFKHGKVIDIHIGGDKQQLKEVIQKCQPG
ncbi:hypothetical protein BgAZ_208790 [Babesia gibsoni]|uniref:Thioredoxin domain-containing protein n=1 Tax=Babesia gibsoni TaxID=33632 RepID=A0AAD8PER4_BABGI|nr:hypothetical protein BgAZ_208790 [Babesia gibsoni]